MEGEILIMTEKAHFHLIFKEFKAKVRKKGLRAGVAAASPTAGGVTNPSCGIF